MFLLIHISLIFPQKKTLLCFLRLKNTIFFHISTDKFIKNHYIGFLGIVIFVASLLKGRFLIFSFTLAFSLFLEPAGGSNRAGAITYPAGQSPNPTFLFLFIFFLHQVDLQLILHCAVLLFVYANSSSRIFANFYFGLLMLDFETDLANLTFI